MALPKFLSDFLSPDAPKVAPPSRTVRPTVSAVPIQTLDPVSERLVRLASQGTPVLGGMVQLLDQQVIAELDDSLVTKLASAVGIELGSYFPRGEVFHHLGELRFVLVFPQLDIDGASRRLRSCTHLLSEAVKRQSAELSSHVTEIFHLAQFEAQALVPESTLPAQTLFAELDRLRTAAAEQFAVERLIKLRKCGVLFFPAWNARRLTTTFNRAVLDARLVSQNSFGVPAGSEVAQLDIDLVLIKKALSALMHHPRNQKFPLVLVAVNFATLQGEPSAITYLQFLASIPSQYRPSLILEVVGIPLDYDPGQLAPTLSQLSQLIRLIVIETGLEHSALNSLQHLKPWAVSLDMGDARGTDLMLAAKLSRFAATAFEAGVNAIAHNIMAPGLALTAANAGIGFIDGPGLQGAIKQPILPTKVTMPIRL